MSEENKRIKVLKTATLDDFSEAVDKTDGIFLKDVPPNTILEIKVADSVFTIVVGEPNQKKVKVRGKFIDELTECVFLGSSFAGGCMLKQGWIGMGMCLNLITPNQAPMTTFVTAPVERINIVGQNTATVQ